MDTSTLEQTANSLKDNFINIVGVLIPNTDKASRNQQLKSIVSVPDDVTDAGFNSIVDLLAMRVKRLVGCLGKNFTRKYIFLLFSKVKKEYQRSAVLSSKNSE